MIPKKIHYCWFGGNAIPERDLKCMESWKKFCPDYEIIRWDESNYDITKNRYMKEAYEAKKWGFVPDYARLDIIYEHGGIYLDTDVEIIRNIDDLLENRAFMGFEVGGKFINFGLGFGAEKNMPLIKELMTDVYSDRPFKIGEGEFDTTPSPVINTEFLVEKGLERNNTLQEVEGMVIYPVEYFCPIDYTTNILSKTPNTYSIHHYCASWHEPEEHKIVAIHQKCKRVFGEKAGYKIGKILCKPVVLKMYLRTKGIKGTMQYILKSKKKNSCNQ